MKTKSIISTLSLLSLLLINSCDNRSDLSNENETTSSLTVNKESNDSSDYARVGTPELGVIHNVVLQEYYDTYGFEEAIPSISVLNERLLAIAKDKYPQIFTNVTATELSNFTNFLYGQNTTITTFEFRDRGELILESAVNQNIISLNFKNFVINLIEANEDAETSIANVDFFMENNELSEKEIELLNDFKSVVTHSDVFWDSNYNLTQTDTTARCNPKHQVRLVDGYGTILGGTFGSVWFPGVGSIIGGAIGGQGFSALIEHMQDTNYGGGCVR
ncbi:hypothetical protein [Chryseobacterium sp. Hurlbut01]|uniref:hypothetical protein n=1 Tax=Chryseobacterium sp. Hurlbut01 TaxID=1681828 RepID=UPI00067AF5C9|nr:hypothetical protein [Chryseobacterium sp. Hurlbut01]KNB62261.1 hypothetical protein AC804_05195 [Chryseobacterium sp. Hurlbut01]